MIDSPPEPFGQEDVSGNRSNEVQYRKKLKERNEAEWNGPHGSVSKPKSNE
jgi:hypothetical protein